MGKDAPPERQTAPVQVAGFNPQDETEELILPQASDELTVSCVALTVACAVTGSRFTVRLLHTAVGTSSSFTVTVNEQVPVLPAASDTFHITVVNPLLNTVPASELPPVETVAPLRVQVVAATPQLSELPAGLNSLPDAV